MSSPAPSRTSTMTGADLFHWYCCDPRIAYCGTDLTDVPENDEGDMCVVCEDLEDEPCNCPSTGEI